MNTEVSMCGYTVEPRTPLNGGQPLYKGQLIKSQIQLPIPVCINAPSIVDTSLFRKLDTAQFPDMASTTVQHLANRGHK